MTTPASQSMNPIWERDSCSCPKCLHPTSFERIVTVVDGGDGPHQPPRAPRGPDPATVTSAPLAAEVPRVPYAELDAPAGVERWLTSMLATGVVIVTGTPNVDGEVVRLAERIGFARPTNFGTRFDVVSQPDPTSNAYTSLGLDLHTDLPYWSSPPDFQFLHAMVTDATGGDSLLVDGIEVAHALRDEFPEAFATLASWPVPFRYLDPVDDIRGTWPVLEIVDGSVVGVRFNNGVRDTDWNARGAEGTAFYEAYLRYWRMLRAGIVSVRLEPGEVLCFDNRRMLHGRAEFDPSTGLRHLQGCYVDRDMVMSRLRCVRRDGNELR